MSARIENRTLFVLVRLYRCDQPKATKDIVPRHDAHPEVVNRVLKAAKTLGLVDSYAVKRTFYWSLTERGRRTVEAQSR